MYSHFCHAEMQTELQSHDHSPHYRPPSPNTFGRQWVQEPFEFELLILDANELARDLESQTCHHISNLEKIEYLQLRESLISDLFFYLSFLSRTHPLQLGWVLLLRPCRAIVLNFILAIQKESVFIYSHSFGSQST